MTTWYMFYQLEDGESKWELSLASEREKIRNDIKPMLTTVLDVDFHFKDDLTSENVYKLNFRGPFYLDFDSDDIRDSIDGFKEMLEKLRDEYEIDLDQLQLYASGGKGFHILLDQKMFHEKQLPARGTPMLPWIYKEMAHELFVDTLDLKIYSARKGRMLREPNLLRTNGKYKVPLTPEEALSITPAKYAELCSAPRPHVITPIKPASYYPKLALLYNMKAQKTSEAIKVAKNRKETSKVLERFKDKPLPTTLSTVMNGENLNENKGFSEISLQLAIAATSIGQSRDDFLKSCEGLIANHKGDSHRYSTPAKRRAHLKFIFDYVDNNPSYAFSIGGLKSVMTKGADVSEIEFPDRKEGEKDSSGITFSISQGISVSEEGIFKKSEQEGIQQVSALGLTDPKQLLDIDTNEVHGYEVKVFVDGEYKKTAHIGMDAFTSRNSFIRFTLSAGSCNTALTDAQIGAIADIMRHQTDATGQKVYAVRREGIDVITTPTGEVDVIWADQFGVVSNLDMLYRLTGSTTDDLQYRTDLRNAPDLVDSEESREFFDRLFHINRPEVVGRIFGFFLSNFMCQQIRYNFMQYPFLQAYGPAGSGKSQTTRLFAKLHYYKVEPVTNSALDSTPFTYDTMSTCSGSIPFILEEYKQREMRKDRLEKSKGILRSNYNGDQIGKGSVQSATGSSKLVLTRHSNKSPVVVLAEALVSQTALQERSIQVPMSKEGKEGMRENFIYCQEHSEVMSALGRMCIEYVRDIPLDKIRDMVKTRVDAIRGVVGELADENERPVFNNAIPLVGLEFGLRMLRKVFGDRYDAEFKRIADAITNAPTSIAPKVMSESAKVLSTMAWLSKYSQDPRTRLLSGEDFVVAGDSLFMRVRNCYIKYAVHERSSGGEALFDTYESFWNAMQRYIAFMSDTCIGNALKDSPNTPVMEFDITIMTKDGVEEFDGGSSATEK